MIVLDKCESIDALNVHELSHFIILNKDGFHVRKRFGLTALPFEESGHFSDSEIEKILGLNNKFSNEISGGIFNGSFTLFEKFNGILSKETLTFLNENYRSCKIYFYNSNLDYLFFFSGIEYGLLFAKEDTGAEFFQKSYDEIIFDFFKLTLGWPEHWNMHFLNTILESVKRYNNEKESEFINFLPTKVIRLT